jgi:exonuclease III
LHRFYQEVKETKDELQSTFQTANIVLAGDFNVVVSPEDSSCEQQTC